MFFTRKKQLSIVAAILRSGNECSIEEALSEADQIIQKANDYKRPKLTAEQLAEDKFADDFLNRKSPPKN